MPRVNLEGATLRGCSMDERIGIHTNLEGEEERERGIEADRENSCLFCFCRCQSKGCDI